MVIWKQGRGTLTLLAQEESHLLSSSVSVRLSVGSSPPHRGSA